ncbi:HD-GYP domain-containing protein [Candidatus Magnetobacterium casense]|uniref:HD-GYP domain-containing protein n=1 Tax=Candidatus Magnetobacterium casense TaxID=1455061 RepID=A0ABS6S173_9BACT|nr:HD-GYP domain-containing protein [Candidatus Magnetobacterium casensis]MBV6342397.1 HD-GYP domain-containing protein [Candidatus Magnetobacterium casensis]
MIKKVRVEDLKPGIYISDLNCSWIMHPFLANKFKLKAESQIQKIIGLGIAEVYIDTEKGLDVEQAVTKQEIQESIQKEFKEVIDTKQHSQQNHVSTAEEAKTATLVIKEAKKIVSTIMDDARMGKQVKMERIAPVVDKMIDSVFRNQDALVSLGRLKNVDEYTFMHSVSVAAMMISFCREINLPRPEIEQIASGAILHDIGKTKVPLTVLNKPGKLTEDEFIQIKQHVTYGVDILENIPAMSDRSMCVVAQHHEHYSGKGYPKGLKGEEIHKYGQMMAIVDVFDAITSNRCYHKGMSTIEAMRKLLEWSDFNFNKAVTHTFIRSIGIYPVGSMVRLKSSKLAVVIDRGFDNSHFEPIVKVVYDINKSKYIFPPFTLDLAKDNTADEIQCHEVPAKWNLDPSVFDP